MTALRRDSESTLGGDDHTRYEGALIQWWGIGVEEVGLRA